MRHEQRLAWPQGRGHAHLDHLWRRLNEPIVTCAIPGTVETRMLPEALAPPCRLVTPSEAL
jgi:hypothetical protein